jgi:phosphoribosyl-ATP pyrophosphohydrolase
MNEVYQDFEMQKQGMKQFIQGDLDRIILKVIEEATELNEVLVKTLTKREDLKPPIEKIIEEAGDLTFRLNVLANKLGIVKQIKDREAEKFQQVLQWHKKNN